MESLNLTTLNGVLPTDQLKAEQEISEKFKTAALSIAELYKSSKQASKRSYNAGYVAACQDVLSMIQHGLSVSGSASGIPDASGSVSGSSALVPSAQPINIGNVMDWIEARLDAIKSREEEEDQDEEREKKTVADSGSRRDDKPVQKVAPTIKGRDPATSMPTPSSPRPRSDHNRGPLFSQPGSPSPPPATVPTTNTKLPQSQSQRPLKSRPSKPDFASTDPTSSPSSPSLPLTQFPEVPSITAGAKRRHAMMMMLDANGSTSPVLGLGGLGTSPPAIFSLPSSGMVYSHDLGHPSPSVNTCGSGNPRRRTRSGRGHGNGAHSYPLVQLQNQQITDAMDVEEDGRERKRVARR